MTTYDVSSLAQLNSAIVAVDDETANYAYTDNRHPGGTISMTSALEAINLDWGVSLTLAGLRAPCLMAAEPSAACSFIPATSRSKT